MMRRASAVVALVLLICGSLPAKNPLTECTVPNAEDLVPNFHRVDAEMYRGGRPAYREDVYLKFAELGIRTVINLEGGSQARREQDVIERVNKKLAEQGKPSLSFISFPIDSFTGTVLSSPSTRGMDQLFTDIAKAPKPIYMHCKYGKDRTGMAVVLYRMWRGESDFEDAMAEANYYHFSYWNFGLKRTIEHFREQQAVKGLGEPPTTAAAGVCKPSLQKMVGKSAQTTSDPRH